MKILATWSDDAGTEEFELNSLISDALSEQSGWLVEDWRFSGEFRDLLARLLRDWKELGKESPEEIRDAVAATAFAILGGSQ